MSALERQALGLIELIYAAIPSPERWRVFLQELVGVMGASAGSMFIQDRASARPLDVFSYVGFEQHSIDQYLTYYSKICPLLPILARLKVGRTRTASSLMPRKELEKTEFYADWLCPQGLADCIAGVIARDDHRNLILSVVHSGRAKLNEEESIWLFDFLMPHLQRAGRVSRQFSRLAADKKALEGGLHHLNVGLFVVDDDASLIFYNRMAEQMTRSADALQVRNNHLCAAIASDTDRLRQLIRSSMTSQGGRSTGRAGVMTLSRSRQSDARPLQILVAPLDEQMTWPWGGRRATAIFAVDPERPTHIDGQTLKNLYGLTPAEARMAATFRNVHGDLARAAEEMGITRDSARQYLKHVFAKTNTHRQPELIELLAGLPNSFIRPDGWHRSASD